MFGSSFVGSQLRNGSFVRRTAGRHRAIMAAGRLECLFLRKGSALRALASLAHIEVAVEALCPALSTQNRACPSGRSVKAAFSETVWAEIRDRDGREPSGGRKLLLQMKQRNKLSMRETAVDGSQA